MKTARRLFFQLALLAFVMLSTEAQAKSFDFLPSKSALQKQVIEQMKAKKYSEAASSFEKAFGPARSATHVALYNYLLFQSGVELQAIESLFRVKSPNQIHKEVRDLWKGAVPADHSIWGAARINWSSRWEMVFPKVSEVQNFTAKPLSLKNKKAIESYSKLLQKTSQPKAQMAHNLYQLALWQGQSDLHQSALYSLTRLENLKQNLISADEIALLRGRIYYQQKKFNEAIAQYNLVSRSSPFWFEAIEEKAWAYFSMNDYSKALSQIKTLLLPIFVSQVGPESYYLAAYVNFKICDYKSVYDIFTDFKTRYKARGKELQILAKTGTNATLEKAIAEATPHFWKQQSAKELIFLPRMAPRDRYLSHHIQVMARLKSEQARLASLGLPTPSSLTKEILSSEKLVKERFQTLARDESQEISKILTHMHLVEAEVIQRLHLERELAKKFPKAEKKKEVLVFPDDGEIWVDEIDKYQVLVKNCSQVGG